MSGPNENDHETIGEVLIVGGGNAGLITALLMREINSGIDVAVVDDFDEEIPEVGKSTLTYITHTLHEILGIDETRFVSEVKPVWKGSVYFTDWCGRGPFHVPFDGYTLHPGDPGPRRFETLYERYETENYHTLGEEIVERGVTPLVRENYYTRRVGDFTQYDQVAYQFGTNRLNRFLRDVCIERGIELINDPITDVRTSDNRIESITSGTSEYESGLYIDATGFERLLMGNLENDFDRFDFPLDSALVAQTDLLPHDIVPATVINSGEYGWFWQIDTFGWRDVGYVYSSEHVSEDEAKAEFLAEKDGISESDVQQYGFESGFYEEAWVENCIAVGNALGFVEPIQSTALTLNARLAEELAELLADHYRINHRGLRDVYNTAARSVWNNVYDFVSIHYRYASGENEFWEAMRSVNDPDRLDEYVGRYHENGFASYEKFGAQGPTVDIFGHYLFYQLLRSLGVDSEFYERVDIEVSPGVKTDIETVSENVRNRANQHLSYGEAYKLF